MIARTRRAVNVVHVLRAAASTVIVRAMRAGLLFVLALTGCGQILGITDPVSRSVDAAVIDTAPPIDTPPAVCSPFDDSSCAFGTCDHNSIDQSTFCRTVGTVSAGAPCTELTDCAASLTCAGHVCVPYCSDAHPCAEGDTCARSLGFVDICEHTCNLVHGTDGGCGTGHSCARVQFDAHTVGTECVSEPFGGNATDGQACDDSAMSPCASGKICLALEGAAKCYPVCIVGVTACSNGRLCVDRDEQLADGQHLGVCK
jgi:hypothetical protein